MIVFLWWVAAWGQDEDTASPSEAFGWQSPTLGTMRWIPPGSFLMGSPEDEPGRHVDEYPHDATVPEGYFMMQTEVTQEQWRAVMGDNPSRFAGCDDCPVEGVSWSEANAFARRASERDAVTYRLPTEVEWEWAARGGEVGARFAGADEAELVGWVRTNSGTPRQTHQVCEKPENGFGLCDMSGNVWEWVADWSFPHDGPEGPPSAYRVVRGGSWLDPASSARVAERAWTIPSDRSSWVGLRLVRVP